MKKTTFLALLLFSFCTSFGQFVQDFESSSTALPLNWAQYQNGFGPTQFWTISSLVATPPFICQGANAALISRENVGAGNTSEDYLVSPQFQVLPGSSELKFFSRQGAAGDQGGIYKIMISTNANPALLSAYTTVQTWTEQQMNIDFSICQEQVVSLSAYAGQTVYLAFVKIAVQPTNAIVGDRWYLDNIRYDKKCEDPTLGSSSNLNATSATLTWTNATSTATAWDLAIINTATNTFTGVPTLSGVGSSTTGIIKTYQATGLLPNTVYQYYVRTVCNANSMSAWSGPYNFNTLSLGSVCVDPIVVGALPYQTANNTANFGDFFDTPQSAAVSCGATPTTTNYLAGNEVFYSYTATVTGQINIQSTPTGPNSSIFVYPGCPIAGNCLAGVANVGSGVRTIPNFAVTAGQTYTIVLSSAAATQTVGYTLLIQQEACAAPFAGIASGITLTTANLSWSDPVPAATAWQVVVQPIGGSVPTTAGTAATNPFTVTGLTAATQYQYWVRAACATPGVFSVWAGPFLFNTLLCAPAEQCVHRFTMRNQLGAGGWNGALMEIRQNNIVVATIGSSFTTGSSAFVNVLLCSNLAFDVFWKTAGTQAAQVGLSINNSFSQNIFNKPAGTSAPGQVVYSNIVNCTTPVCNIAPINLTSTSITTNSAILSWTSPANTNWDVFIVPFGSPLPGAATTPTYANVASSTLVVTGLLADTQYTFYVRVVCSPVPSDWSAPKSFTTLPTCVKPTNLGVTGITQTAATFSWTNGSTTDNLWELLLVPSLSQTAPTLLPPANPVLTPGMILVATTTVSPVTISTLTPATIYYYYVRTVCVGNDKSTWSGPYVFNTVRCNLVPGEACVYRFVMSDTAANTWNGATMQVRQNGIVVATLGAQLLNGATTNGPGGIGVLLCKDLNFDLVWNNAGTAPNEVGISILDPNNDPIFSKLAGQGAVSTTPLYTSTVNCNPPSCPKPTTLTAVAAQTSALLGWTETGTATQWEVYVKPSTPAPTPPVNGSALNNNVAPYYIANSNPFTVVGLLPQTSYTYWVRAICASPTNVSNWTLTLNGPKSFFTTPLNDECAFAINVPINPTQVCAATLVVGSTLGATASAPLNLTGLGCGTSDDDVWFKFMATNNIHIINLKNILGNPSSVTINHSLFSGSCTNLTNIYCNSTAQSVATGLTIGQTYYIRVYTAGSISAQTASFGLCIGTPPPPATNDECANAITAVVNLNSKCNQITPGNIIGATASTNAPVLASTCQGVADDDVWFKFTATSTIHYFNLLNVSGTTTNLNHAVYSGTCNALTLKYCSGANSLAGNNATFVIGQVYYVRVWSNENTSQVATFDLCIKSVSTCENAEFLCGTSPNDPPYIIDNTTGILPGAGAVGCLITTPNPTYYVLKIGQTGPVKFEIRQSTDINNFPLTGAPGIDVDFVAWGPFANSQSCSQIFIGPCSPPCPNNITNPTFYPSGNIIDCSYSANPVETLNIPNAQAGQFYVLLLTNFNQAAGYIKLLQTNTTVPNAGQTICCDVQLGPDKNICGTNVTLNALTGVDPLTVPSSFEWYYNGSATPIVGATSSTYVATQSGTYKVKGTCNQTSVFSKIEVTLNQQTYVSIQYPGLVSTNNLCNNLGSVSPTYYYSLTQNPSPLPNPSATAVSSTGIFSATPAGLSINVVTGVVDTALSTVGTYQVKYVTDAVGSCSPITASATVVLTANIVQGSITYNSPFCKTAPVQNVTTTFASGGTFLSTAGLSLNATTGQITPSTSTPGQYQVRYIYAAYGGCLGFTLTTSVTIIPVSDIALQSGCKGTQYILEASPIGNSYNPATAVYNWTNPSGQPVAGIVGQLNAIVAMTQGIYTVTITTPDGCKSSQSTQTSSIACEIQKGISPNGDGKNDTFDLTTLGVKQLEIFNRFGTSVYNLENYTNQWGGQSASGMILPDGTYFYVIQKADGTAGITGWIYINR